MLELCVHCGYGIAEHARGDAYLDGMEHCNNFEFPGKKTLERRTPLRAKPRSKGNRAEREVIDILKRFGYVNARRNWQSGGQGGGDILNGPAGFNIEVKHRERAAIWEWIAQSEADAQPTEVPLVVFRRNHSQWYVCLPFEDWLSEHGAD